MTLNLTMPKVEAELKPRITVVGCGGAGGNAVSNMIRAKLEGVEFVVANTDSQSLAQSLAERRVQLYHPHQHQSIAQMTFALRSRGDATAVVTAARQAILAIDPDQPIAQVRTMTDMMDEALGQRKLSLYLLGTFAGLALLLSAIGIYGVMSFDVTRRSQELGVRMALGAARSSVLSLVMKQGAGLALLHCIVALEGSGVGQHHHLAHQIAERAEKLRAAPHRHGTQCVAVITAVEADQHAPSRLADIDPILIGDLQRHLDRG